jgi:hypothetical protein
MRGDDFLAMRSAVQCSVCVLAVLVRRLMSHHRIFRVAEGLHVVAFSLRHVVAFVFDQETIHHLVHLFWLILLVVRFNNFEQGWGGKKEKNKMKWTLLFKSA